MTFPKMLPGKRVLWSGRFEQSCVFHLYADLENSCSNFEQVQICLNQFPYLKFFGQQTTKKSLSLQIFQWIHLENHWSRVSSKQDPSREISKADSPERAFSASPDLLHSGGLGDLANGCYRLPQHFLLQPHWAQGTQGND